MARLALALSLIPGPALARGEALLELPLRLKVATCAGRPIREEVWVRAHLSAAQRVLAPHRIRLLPALESFRPRSCQALDRAGRNALASHVSPAGVTVLVVERVADLDLAGYDLMGVHWRYSGTDKSLAGRRYILLTARARPPVLAHELGHYLGLAHDPAGGNLMTPGPSDPVWRRAGARRPAPFAPQLTASQARRLRAAIRGLRALPPASYAPATRPRNLDGRREQDH